jgi:hypothetical protein
MDGSWALGRTEEARRGGEGRAAWHEAGHVVAAVDPAAFLIWIKAAPEGSRKASGISDCRRRAMSHYDFPAREARRMFNQSVLLIAVIASGLIMVLAAHW